MKKLFLVGWVFIASVSAFAAEGIFGSDVSVLSPYSVSIDGCVPGATVEQRARMYSVRLEAALLALRTAKLTVLQSREVPNAACYYGPDGLQRDGFAPAATIYFMR